MSEQVASEGFTAEQLEAVKMTVNSLLLALKTYSIYPEGHINREQAVQRFHTNMAAFVKKYGAMMFDVDKGELLYQGKVVHSGPSDEGNIAFSLFRDGVKWVKFLEGIACEETKALVQILDLYKKLPAEAEGDLVTALWAAELPHVTYEAIESFLETVAQEESAVSEKQSAPVRSVFGFAVNPSEVRSLPSIESISESATFEVVDISKIDCASLELTPNDIQTLHAAVAREERLDPTREVLDMMVDILHDQDEEEEELFSIVLDFLAIELKEAFIGGQFHIAHKILGGLRHVHQICEKARSWALPQLDESFSRASSQEFLCVLEEISPEIGQSQLEDLRRVLVLLPPLAIRNLAPLLLRVKAAAMQGMLKEVIRELATTDLSVLESTLRSSGDELTAILVGVMDQIDGDGPMRILAEMSRHRSERVRREALSGIMNRNAWIPDQLFSLIDDESMIVRQLLLKYLGSQKSLLCEELLVNYLRGRKWGSGDKGQVFACFRTLGLCGSEESIPFLQAALCKGGLFSRIRGSIVRQGAAIGLQTLGSEAARDVLLKAVGSRFPGVRNAAKMATLS